ncbi:MAG: response regulator [Bacteroidales bacterium]|jgi:CheY-like chemotaxis protein|nr:response regulator [Bacteroidales bacterium]
MYKRIIFLFFLIAILLTNFHSLAQNLDSSVQNKIDEYKSEVEKYSANKNTIQQSNFLNKIAYLYWENEKYSEAVEYFTESLQLNRANKNLNGQKSIYYNIGLIYSDKEDYQNSLINFNKGLDIARQINQNEGIYSGLMNKASVLKNLSRNQEAIKCIKDALGYAKEFNNLKLIRSCYGMLAENFELLGDSENTMKYFEQFATIDKHIKSEQVKNIEEKSKEQVQRAQNERLQTEKNLSETSDQLEKTQQNLFETEEIKNQQQLELELKELTIRENEAELRNKRNILIGIAFIFFLILIFSVLVLRQFKAKKKANKLLEEQNEQIKLQKTEIESQRDLAHQQKKDITDSIEYAKRIQSALLPPLNFIKRNLPEHFILFKPRDIVSGDFYWMMNKNDKIIIAAADCTGHGVPGAFMSMLGTAFLNEIVTKIIENKHVYSLQANEILNQLRNYIIESLHQTGAENESKDGIDIAICIIDSEKHKLQYAGAHNPLYLIRNKKLEVIKGDRMPVGIHKNAAKSFQNHEFDIEENDIIYLFSDGYYDQIGGPDHRKYMSRNFQNLLFDIHEKPMIEQKEILKKNIEDWQGDYIQLDDILVIGIKLEVAKEKNIKLNTYDWKGKTILIAEDTEMNYIFLVEALKHTNVDILRAKDGEEAIEVFNNNDQIDLILMDINMPKLDGFETTRKIKEIRKNVPVIAQTALNIEDAREKSIEVGCDDFILKPIKLKLFLTKLDSYLKS